MVPPAAAVDPAGVVGPETAVSDPAWLDWFWPAWLGLLAAGFVVAETVALVSRGRGGALTEKTKRWLGVDPPRPWRHRAVLAFVLVLVGLTVWLVPHMTHWPARWFWET